MAKLNLSPQQDQALMAIRKWRRSSEQIFRVFGFAGCGKTTLGQYIAEDVGGQVLFAAYTGKAAHVMRRKGCEGASTIHSLIYRAEDVFVCPGHPDDTYWTDTEGCRWCGGPLVRRSRPNFVINRESPLAAARLLIIDECSMVAQAVGRDLKSFNVPILVLGDPAQLPPPKGCGFFTDAEPDVMLTEVHRQARDNPIIRMSMTVREGGRLDIGRYGESQVAAACDIENCTADQILVGLNVTRVALNSWRRSELGLTDPLPMVGDRLVCLRNNHAKELLNGSLWDVVKAFRGEDAGIIHLQVKPDDGGNIIEVATPMGFFNGGSPPECRGYDEFTYGYALTVHKAQGSQWDSVLLFDESARFRENAARWLYTAITRAAKRITIVRGRS